MNNFFSSLFSSDPPPEKGLLETPLVHFSTEDSWRIRDAVEGCLIFGATGAGKTSGSGHIIATSFLNAGFGGLVLCAKSDEKDMWQEYCREAGREEDLIIVSPSSQWKFNFLDYEYQRPGAGAGLVHNINTLLSQALEIMEGGGNNHQGDSYWKRARQQLICNALTLITVARNRITLLELYEIITSAAQTPEDTQRSEWQNVSLCFQCIREGEAKSKTKNEAHDFRLAVRYWLLEFPALADRTRSIIVSEASTLMDSLLRNPIYSMFCTDTTLTPEESFAGRIILLDLAVKDFGAIGQAAQVIFKRCWQQAAERRSLEDYPLPVFLWADEAQNFCVGHDTLFQSTARSSRVCSVYLTQNISGFTTALGKPQTTALFGNLQTKIFCQNGDAETNAWAADIFSKSFQSRTNMGTSTRDGGMSNQVTRNFGTSEALNHEILPQEFTCLRKGGPDNDFSVDAIVFQGGRQWRATGKNSIRLTFSQKI